MSAQHANLSPEDLLGFTLPPRARAATPEEVNGLVARLGEVAIDWTLLGPLLAFDARGYVRRRLHRDRSWEMLLLSWLPGQGTVVHDHGGSWGVVKVLSGELFESRYRVTGEGAPLQVAVEQTCGPGSVLGESVETIHRNVNRSATPAVSLHLYSPPLTVLNSYDPVTGSRHEVRLDEGPAVAVGGRPGVRLGRGRARQRRKS